MNRIKLLAYLIFFIPFIVHPLLLYFSKLNSIFKEETKAILILVGKTGRYPIKSFKN